MADSWWLLLRGYYADHGGEAADGARMVPTPSKPCLPESSASVEQSPQCGIAGLGDRFPLGGSIAVAFAEV